MIKNKVAAVHQRIVKGKEGKAQQIDVVIPQDEETEQQAELLNANTLTFDARRFESKVDTGDVSALVSDEQTGDKVVTVVSNNLVDSDANTITGAPQTVSDSSVTEEQVGLMPASVVSTGSNWALLGGAGLALAALGGGGSSASTPSPLTIDPIATDDIIGPTERNTTIQGKTVAGATVKIKLGGIVHNAVVTDTTWRYDLTPDDFAAMGQGEEEITVVAALADGKTFSATRTIKVSTLGGIVDIAITSTQGIQNHTLNTDDVVFVTVSMSDAFTVVGIPQLKLDIGGKSVLANYASGSGTSSLVFSYKIAAGLNDQDGIGVAGGALILNGGSVLDANGKPPASLSHGAVVSNENYLVDTTNPTLITTSYDVLENTTAVATLKGSDFSDVTYSLGEASDADTGLFSISSDGVLTLLAGADFESLANTTPSHAYVVKVNMTDHAGNIGSQAVTVRVIDVNEAPVFTSNGKASVAENSLDVAYQATAIDVDSATTLTYSLSGVDARFFNVNSKTGAVSFKISPDYEKPEDDGANHVYNLMLTASDGKLSATQDVEITVTNLSDLHFNLNFLSNFSAEAQEGFRQAAAFWSSVFNDDIEINLDLDYRSTGFDKNTIGSTNSTHGEHSYSDFRRALVADATTKVDDLAVRGLATGDTFGMLLNHTHNNPDVLDPSHEYIDNNQNQNNQAIFLTNANAKALGLLSSHTDRPDATIAFNSAYDFDFDRSDGIGFKKTDFVGVAIHEIGHALGFTSGVDYLDAFPGFYDHDYPFVSPLDLFRYSVTSSQLGVIDWTSGMTDKYFSLDNGLTKIASFSTGVEFGDGRQASHWKDALGLGALDPTLSAGELLKYTNLDQMAFDAIGWNLIKTGSNLSAPQITSFDTVTYMENSTAAAYTAVATDADAWNPISFALSGTDAKQFSIDSRTGVVKFVTPPDYEAPTDVGADNTYRVTITANDGIHNSTPLVVTINVTNNPQNITQSLANASDMSLNHFGLYNTHQVM